MILLRVFLCGWIFMLLAGCEDWAGDAKAVSGSPNKLRLYNYLADNYGSHIIAGQMDTAWSDSPSMDMVARVFQDTGRYPALKGFDFLNIQNPSWEGGGSKQTQEAIQWWENPPLSTISADRVNSPADRVNSYAEPVNSPVEPVNSPVERVNSPADRVNSYAERVNSPVDRVNSPVDRVNSPAEPVNSSADAVNSPAEPVNSSADAVNSYSDAVNSSASSVNAVHGIIAFCWHWRPGGAEDFYTDRTRFRIPWKNGKLDKASTAWRTIIADLDLVAAELQKLEDKDIPVLWRPLHEASGGWFWWGASGAKPYIALWEFMYDYLTNVKGLSNLLWVWNGQKAEWFPQASTVDIVGTDIYPEPQDYGAQSDLFYETRDMVPERNCMVALTENGEIPDPDLLAAYQVKWSWFMTWNDGGQEGTNENNFWSGEYHNTSAHKQKVYNHAYVITLDELPDLTAYGED